MEIIRVDGRRELEAMEQSINHEYTILITKYEELDALRAAFNERNGHRQRTEFFKEQDKLFKEEEDKLIKEERTVFEKQNAMIKRQREINQQNVEFDAEQDKMTRARDEEEKIRIGRSRTAREEYLVTIQWVTSESNRQFALRYPNSARARQYISARPPR